MRTRATNDDDDGGGYPRVLVSNRMTDATTMALENSRFSIFGLKNRSRWMANPRP